MKPVPEHDRLNRYDVLLFVIVILALLSWALHGKAAHAAGTTANVSWTLPTQGTQTNPTTGAQTTVTLDPTTIASTTIQWMISGTTTLVGSKVVATPATSVQIPGLICGNYDFNAFVTLTAPAGGASSPDSAPPVTYSTQVSCTVPKAPALQVSFLHSLERSLRLL